MDRLPEKIRRVEEDISREKGSLNLFALFEREDVWDLWDVVISAPWARRDLETYGYLSDILKRHLTTEELMRVARTVVLPASEEPVLSINEVYDVEHGEVEMSRPARFGLPVKFGYIITSRRAAA